MKTPIPVIKQNPPKETETARMPRSSILIPAATPTTAIRKTLISSSAAQRAAQSRTMRMLIRIGAPIGAASRARIAIQTTLAPVVFFFSFCFSSFSIASRSSTFLSRRFRISSAAACFGVPSSLITACSFSGPASAKYSVKYSIASS